jgi:DNA (cytosine-5)-methyltransferase 1
VHNHITTVNSDKVRDRLAHIPVGGNWKDAPSKFAGINIKYYSVYRRLDPSAPSVTLGHFRKNMLIHPLQNRLLSLREGARLQSFPDDYYFEGHIDSMQQQIADAAPPLLGVVVGKRLMKLFRA